MKCSLFFFADRDKLFVLINKLGITVANGFKECEKTICRILHNVEKCAKKE